jgi:hypothetical protein
MGVTEYPCPKCGTPQRVRAPNGQEVKQNLCAACAEKEQAQQQQQQEAHDEEARDHETRDKQKARAR